MLFTLQAKLSGRYQTGVPSHPTSTARSVRVRNGKPL
jgi:hypothetical protein